MDNPITVITEIKRFSQAEFDAEFERFQNSLPEWAIEFLEDAGKFLNTFHGTDADEPS